MTYNPQKPRYTFKLGEKTYELEGTFGVIEAAEAAMREDILHIISRCGDMPAFEMSKLIAAILTECRHPISAKEVGDIIWGEVGIDTPEFTLIRLHTHAALRIFVAKPSNREAVAKRMGEILGETTNLSSSLGETTSDFASVS